jgi:hypothetical protein
MLASITPLGERGRRSTWSVTVTAFAAGATVAGAAAGALVGAVGGLALPAGRGGHGALIAVGGALAVALALDVLAPAVPGPRRQVNERWLDSYRGWVYGLGYGAQLGLGLTTIVSSAATYAAFVAAWLAGPARGAVIVGCFGAIRGLTPLAAAHVRTPAELMAVHRGLARWRAPVRRGSTGALAALCLLALTQAVL